MEPNEPIPSLDPRVRDLKPSATLAISERGAELIRQGHQVCRLGLGQSAFPVPPEVVDALRDSAAHGEYLAVSGLPALREAVADHHRRVDQIDFAPQDILVGPGSKELIYLAQLAFDGDILVPVPCWVSYTPQALIAGRRIARIPTGYDQGWQLRPDQLDDICRNDQPRPRLLILNYPGNPNGNSYELDELQELAEVARRYQLVVLSDEVYGRLSYDHEHISIARYYPEGTIVSSGLSKWCGAAGWRIGTFAFPPQLRWLYQAIRSLGSSTFSCAAAPIQYAAVAAFRGSPSIEEYVEHSRRIMGALSRWCTRELRKAGCLLHNPRGGFYLFPAMSPLAEQLASRGITTDEELCHRALDEIGVAFLPGQAFGVDAGSLTARLAYVDFDGELALRESLSRGQRPIDEAFLRRCCAPVLDGIERLCGWLAS